MSDVDAVIPNAGDGCKSAIQLLENPLHCPGTYTLDLYCKWKNPAHLWTEFPHEIVQFQTYAAAAKFARLRGWILHRDGYATCPKCAAALGLLK